MFPANEVRQRRYRGSLIALLLALSACAPAAVDRLPPQAVRGVMDLSRWDFRQNGPLPLEGEWEFHWNRLLGPDDLERNAAGRASVIALPSYWNGRQEGGKTLSGHGFATFRLRVLLPPGAHVLGLFSTDVLTAHRTFVNGIEVSRNGVVASTPDATQPEYLPRLAQLGTAEGELEILVQVANFHHRLGGIWSTPRLGLASELQGERDRRRELELFLVGALLIMGIYHLTLFALRRKDRSALYFGLCCLAIVVRLVTTGERYLAGRFPHGPFELYSKLEYLSYMMALPLFALFARSLFPAQMNARIVKAILVMAGGFCLLVLAAPVSVYSYSVTSYYVLLCAGCLYAVVVAIRAIIHREPGALLFLAGFSALFATTINDILYNELIIRSAYLTPFGLWLFIFAQAALLAKRFAGAFRRVEVLSTSFERFVPRDVLRFLGRESILDIQLGDAVQKDMTILFSDLRNFSSISETMEPSENFAFLNAVYRRVSPAIREQGGFIDKYMGDGIMALFPDNPADAVQAAMSMQRLVEEYNRERTARGYQPIATGFGIHCGGLMLGTVGESQRMDPTVISDAVNLASRLEGVSKALGIRIVISGSVHAALEDPRKTGVRPLGRIRVRGRAALVEIFEVFGGGSAAEIERRRATQTFFEEGLRKYHARDFGGAMLSFEGVLKLDASDTPAGHYLAQARAFMENAPAPDWDGSIERLAA